jgi:hypothetical protein
MGYRSLTFDDGGLSISLGNTKLGNVPNFNISPGAACVNPEMCKGTFEGRKYNCYSVKAARLYPNVRRAWRRNLLLCKNYQARTKRQLHGFFQTTKPHYFRIHSAGDFFSQAYFDMWANLAQDNRFCKMLAFTKAFNLNMRRRPRNLRIVRSIMPKQKLANVPAGARAFAGKRPKHGRIFECVGSCEHCKHCWNMGPADNVFFALH